MSYWAQLRAAEKALWTEQKPYHDAATTHETKNVLLGSTVHIVEEGAYVEAWVWVADREVTK